MHGADCLVLGFGRVAKTLAHKLKALDARVCVEARKYEDLAWIDAYGYEGVHLANLGEYIGAFDVIFNTIPTTILDRRMLERVSPDALIIDLASKPGGVDLGAAQQLGRDVIWALSLPGKVAPNTAGNIIKDTILNMIHEMEVK